MVVSLGPGKFYGTSLPRPRIYTDVKLNDHRVDPPLSVMDPFLSWANEAHWSMGGLSYKRLRLQGRIEGNVSKLRAEREKIAKKNEKFASKSPTTGSDPGVLKRKKVVDTSGDDDESPPPAPIATKRRRFMDLIDEDMNREDEEIGSSKVRRRRLVKKLTDDFDKVAEEKEKACETPSRSLRNGGSGSNGLRSRRLILEDSVAPATEIVMDIVKEVNKLSSKGKKLKGSATKVKSGGGSESSPVTRSRNSPRLAKQK
ncbi:hypothetical protein CsatB_020612 [Cannabis sativa]|uniref:Uncharacterized protein n=1 Tax=Cannabis sativa TaxID=3483 RepID=A0A7J6GIG2_CANSA|nr:uncharacterized protein LOC133030306 [Cannabis sativa]KAF4382724.1 hypothetical protein F8388_015552 [Cannabis sativa]KAF4386453.1 hypothetical protein G4B88_006709 [Cannabis sativa]